VCYHFGMFNGGARSEAGRVLENERCNDHRGSADVRGGAHKRNVARRKLMLNGIIYLAFRFHGIDALYTCGEVCLSEVRPATANYLLKISGAPQTSAPSPARVRHGPCTGGSDSRFVSSRLKFDVHAQVLTLSSCQQPQSTTTNYPIRKIIENGPLAHGPRTTHGSRRAWRPRYAGHGHGQVQHERTLSSPPSQFCYDEN
jgi:hypothetical protein